MKQGKTFGLIGEKLGHSLSGQIHSRLFAALGAEARYDLIEIPREGFADTFPRLLAEYDGLNVTIPYKRAVLPYLEALSPEAADYGAVNTVDCAARTGHNTDVTGFLVPIMAIIYLGVGAVVIVFNYHNIPAMFSAIFSGAFDFKAIFGGFAGSAMMLGIKRGLYSNEAGVGSAPNAAASASVSHPAKQGLVQMLSVFIDTMIICTFTAFVVLSSGVGDDGGVTGAPLVKDAMATVLGQPIAQVFISLALFLFAFTTLVGNFYYAEVNFRFLLRNIKLEQWMLTAFRLVAAALVFCGALLKFEVAWSLGDILMGLMALINLPVIVILGRIAVRCANDYTAQRKKGLDPKFTASSIGLDPSELDYWQDKAPASDQSGATVSA